MITNPSNSRAPKTFALERPVDATAAAPAPLNSHNSDLPRSAEVPSSTFLTSQRLWFRAPAPSDMPLLTAWRNSRRVRRTMSPRFPVAEETLSQWIDKHNPFERGKANDHAFFMFGLKGTGTPIGNAGLFGINWVDRNASFGIAIDPDHWSQGYGREVARQMLDYGFFELNLHRVELTVDGCNPGGIKAYEAAGFAYEGTRRQASFVEGRWHDILVMSVLRDEWNV